MPVRVMRQCFEIHDATYPKALLKAADESIPILRKTAIPTEVSRQRDFVISVQALNKFTVHAGEPGKQYGARRRVRTCERPDPC